MVVDPNAVRRSIGVAADWVALDLDALDPVVEQYWLIESICCWHFMTALCFSDLEWDSSAFSPLLS